MIDHPQLNTLRHRWLRMAETRHAQAKRCASVDEMKAYVWAAAAFEIASTELAMVQTGHEPPDPGERWPEAEAIAERVAKHLSRQGLTASPSKEVDVLGIKKLFGIQSQQNPLT